MRINASDAASGKVALADMPATFLVSQENKALEYLVVSVDGETNACLEKLGDLPEDDYKAVLDEVNRIRRPFSPAELSAAWRRYFAVGSLEYPEQMVIAKLCREMKWGYEEFLAQPQWFVHMILSLIIEESNKSARQSS